MKNATSSQHKMKNATSSFGQTKKRVFRGATCKFRGVCWIKSKRVWRATSPKRGFAQGKNLGEFFDKDLAMAAYDQDVKNHGGSAINARDEEGRVGAAREEKKNECKRLRGVRRHRNKFQCHARIRRVLYNFGSFETEKEASYVYDYYVTMVPEGIPNWSDSAEYWSQRPAPFKNNGATQFLASL